MTRTRWRGVAGAAAVLAVAVTLIAERQAGERYARAHARRTAESIASYLQLVAPPGRRGTGYDLAPLLVQARGLATLPGLAVEVEVYHGTAPLARATGPALAPDLYERLRRREVTAWIDGRAVVPLKDQDDGEVVGAVAARPRDPRSPATEPLLLGAVAAMLVVGWAGARALGGEPGAGRGALLACGAAGLLLAVTAYAGVHGAAAASTNAWLGDARLLLQEATARAPRGRVTLADLRRIAPGATLAPGDSTAVAPRRERRGGRPAAVVAVRLAAWRWLELRTLPAEALSRGWLALFLAAGAVAPLGLGMARWGVRAAARPRELRETVTGWAFLAPAGLHLAVFAFGPVLFAVYLALHRWSPAEPFKPFVGLANFAELARDPLVWTSLRNTAVYALYVPATMAVALAAALVLQRAGRGVRLLRAALLLPTMSSVVALALVWQWLFHADVGVLNWLLSYAGLGPVDWLGDPRTALLAVMLVSAWVQVGYQMVVFLAGLQGIPQAYLDAARVDGANAWQRFWRVTFPLLKPVTLFVLVTGVIGSFQVFTYIYVLTNGGPLHATDVVVYRIYETAWEFLRFGQASALALVLFAILFGVTWAQFRLLGRRVEYA